MWCLWMSCWNVSVHVCVFCANYCCICMPLTVHVTYTECISYNSASVTMHWACSCSATGSDVWPDVPTNSTASGQTSIPVIYWACSVQCLSHVVNDAIATCTWCLLLSREFQSCIQLYPAWSESNVLLYSCVYIMQCISVCFQAHSWANEKLVIIIMLCTP